MEANLQPTWALARLFRENKPRKVPSNTNTPHIGYVESSVRPPPPPPVASDSGGIPPSADRCPRQRGAGHRSQRSSDAFGARKTSGVDTSISIQKGTSWANHPIWKALGPTADPLSLHLLKNMSLFSLGFKGNLSLLESVKTLDFPFVEIFASFRETAQS